ncbi:unnamed protein product [Soboliphyme baturini]|uniref:Calcium channel flower n=1 Tax=Soboliphyme baturini TaxID=241478 RepID=A0A183J4I8_9BILA|nr:unnamed protein product [Soboliphyme baturini]
MDQKSAQKPSDESPGWWLKFLARTVGTFGGLMAVALGLFACISFHALCLVAGLTQMYMFGRGWFRVLESICHFRVIGLFVVAMEAPCFCPCLDFIDRIGSFSEAQPHWRKTLIYGMYGEGFAVSIIPVLLCLELSTFFGCVLIFITAMLYGIMALGKKAGLPTMMARASAKNDQMEINLVTRDKDPAAVT